MESGGECLGPCVNASRKAAAECPLELHNSPHWQTKGKASSAKNPKGRKERLLAKDRVKAPYTQEMNAILSPHPFFSPKLFSTPITSSHSKATLKEREKVNPAMVSPGPVRTQQFMSGAPHSSRPTEAKRHHRAPGTGQWNETGTSVMLTMLSRLVLTTKLLGNAVPRTGVWPKFVFSLNSICMSRNG